MQEGFSHDPRLATTIPAHAGGASDLLDDHPLVTPPALPGELERQAAALPAMPDLDPVAYLGTPRHPVSMPPIVQDIAPVVRPTRSKVHRTALVLAAGALLVPFLFGIQRTSIVDDDRVRGSNPTTLSALQSIRVTAVPEDEVAVSPEANEALSTEAAPSPAVDVELPAVEIASSARPRARGVRPAVVSSGASFDLAAAVQAVEGSGVGTGDCGPEANGKVAVAVTFAPSGETKRAVVEDGPLRGTATGSCIALRLRRVRIAPFDGSLATLRTTLTLR